MAIFASDYYENGTSGATLVGGDIDNTSPSPVAIQGVTIAAGNTLTYDAKALTSGSISCKRTLTVANCYWAWTTNWTLQAQFYLRGYFQFSALPTGGSTVLWFGQGGTTAGVGGTTLGWRIQINSTGQLVLANGTTSVASSTTTITGGQTFRVELFVDHTNGALTARLFVGANSEGTTPDETITASGLTMPTVNTSRFFCGPNIGTASTYWDDAIAAATGTWIGPAVTTTNIAKTGGAVSVGIAGGTKPGLQYQRPNADLAATGWTPTPSTPTTLYDKVDETTASDTDYISSTAV